MKIWCLLHFTPCLCVSTTDCVDISQRASLNSTMRSSTIWQGAWCHKWTYSYESLSGMVSMWILSPEVTPNAWRIRLIVELVIVWARIWTSRNYSNRTSRPWPTQDNSGCSTMRSLGLVVWRSTCWGNFHDALRCFTFSTVCLPHGHPLYFSHKQREFLVICNLQLLQYYAEKWAVREHCILTDQVRHIWLCVFRHATFSFATRHFLDWPWVHSILFAASFIALQKASIHYTFLTTNAVFVLMSVAILCRTETLRNYLPCRNSVNWSVDIFPRDIFLAWPCELIWYCLSSASLSCRKWNTAQYQNIVLGEWFEEWHRTPLPQYNGYDDNETPDIDVCVAVVDVGLRCASTNALLRHFWHVWISRSALHWVFCLAEIARIPALDVSGEDNFSPQIYY